jgi:RNA polymerase sigma-70 factor (ECF subfamily)
MTDLTTGEPHDGPRWQFPSADWADVLEARDASDGRRRREATARLISAYWMPVHFLVRRRGFDAETAKDLTQGFFAAFLERNFLRYVDPPRGQFPVFLRATVEHFLADEWARLRTQKRGGLRPHLELTAVDQELGDQAGAGPADPERLLRRKWAFTMMARALEAVRARYQTEGRGREFQVLGSRLTGAAERSPTYAEMAAELGVSESDVTNRLHRLRKRYRAAIWDEMYALTRDEAQAHEEMHELFAAISS